MMTESQQATAAKIKAENAARLRKLLEQSRMAAMKAEEDEAVAETKKPAEEQGQVADNQKYSDQLQRLLQLRESLQQQRNQLQKKLEMDEAEKTPAPVDAQKQLHTHESHAAARDLEQRPEYNPPPVQGAASGHLPGSKTVGHPPLYGDYRYMANLNYQAPAPGSWAYYNGGTPIPVNIGKHYKFPEGSKPVNAPSTPIYGKSNNPNLMLLRGGLPPRRDSNTPRGLSSSPSEKAMQGSSNSDSVKQPARPFDNSPRKPNTTPSKQKNTTPPKRPAPPPRTSHRSLSEEPEAIHRDGLEVIRRHPKLLVPLSKACILEYFSAIYGRQAHLGPCISATENKDATDSACFPQIEIAEVPSKSNGVSRKRTSIAVRCVILSWSPHILKRGTRTLLTDVQILLVRSRKSNRLSLPGGYWYSTDDRHPNDDKDFIRVAVRSARASCGVDLQKCHKWVRLVDMAYNYSTESGPSAPKQRQQVKIYMANLRDIVERPRLTVIATENAANSLELRPLQDFVAWDPAFQADPLLYEIFVGVNSFLEEYHRTTLMALFDGQMLGANQMIQRGLTATADDDKSSPRPAPSNSTEQTPEREYVRSLDQRPELKRQRHSTGADHSLALTKRQKVNPIDETASSDNDEDGEGSMYGNLACRISKKLIEYAFS